MGKSIFYTNYRESMVGENTYYDKREDILKI